MHVGDLTRLPTLDLAPGYDGLFCKGSNNPFWFHNDEAALREFTTAMLRLLRPSGWAWIVSSPASRAGVSVTQYDEWLLREEAVYRDLGFGSWVIPSRWRASFYGISFEPPRMTVFMREPARFQPSLSHLPRQCAFVLRASARRVRRVFA